MRRNLQWLVGLAVSALALWVALNGVDLADTAARLSGARYVFLVPALALILVGQLARARSWQTVLGSGLRFRRVFDALNAGYLLNNVLPFRLGELGRAYLIGRTGAMTIPQALSAVVVDRLIDLCMIMGIMTAFLPTVLGLTWARAAVVLSAGVTALALISLFTLARSRGLILRAARWLLGRWRWRWLAYELWEPRLAAFIDGLAALQDGRRFALAAFWSSLAWVCAGLSAWLIILTILPAAPVGMGFFMLIITALSIAAPSAPGSVGVWQWAVMLALSGFGVARGPALGIALLHHLANYGTTSLLGAWALAREGETLVHLMRAAQQFGRRAPADPPALAEPLSKPE